MKNFISKIADWQHWPSFIFYLPLASIWIWYCIKSRAVWFFSTSNPTLAFGGFEGESKQEMYLQLPRNFYPLTIYLNPDQSIPEVVADIKKHRFNYPFIVKPEVGTSGILVRKIENEDQFRMYHKNIPVSYMVQDFVNYPMEVCIFYYRKPGEKKGRISGFISKQLPVLTGDGFSTINELLKSKTEIDIQEESCKLDSQALDRILKQGEIFYLSVIGNRHHGSEFHNLSANIDSGLLELFDKISLGNNFYFGRYDIKCESVEDLKKGLNFSILEFNGSGSIPNHVFTKKYTLLQAYKEIGRHWKILHEISSYNHKKGLPYWKFLNGYRFLNKAMKHYRTLREYDKMIPY
ncbi:MAG: hypothetical protein ABIY62_07420 [Ginsengibacter sp.]